MTFEEIITKAKSIGCSDVHITVGTPVAFRQFGKLKMQDIAPSLAESEALILSSLDEKQKQQVLAGEDLDFAMFTSDNTRLRVNVYHQRNNLAASYRILQNEIPSFESLGLPSVMKDLANEPRGLVLVTGPTGSGKTTTLAAIIDYINRRMEKHIITIEDPIEYVYGYSRSMIHQREVHRDVADFASALRSSLREDPDIILVGEMRDLETINAAITAAETGHLVLATLHTTGAAATIDRIIDAFPTNAQAQARVQLANTLRGVISQVLVPAASGTGMCLATEVLIGTDAVANQIREGKTHQIQSSIQSGRTLGMHSLADDLAQLVREGKITQQTARRYE